MALTRILGSFKDAILTNVVSSSAQIASDISGSFLAKADKSAISGSVVGGVSGSAASTGSFGSIYVGKNVNASAFVGDGSSLTGIDIPTAAAISGSVVSGVSGSAASTGSFGSIYVGKNVNASSFVGDGSSLTGIDIPTAAAISGSHTSGFEFDGSISGSSTSTGSFGRINVGGGGTEYIINDSNNDIQVYAGGNMSINMNVDVAGKLSPQGDLDMVDDKGIVFGSGDDYWFGARAGEGWMDLNRGGTQGVDGDDGRISFHVGPDGGTPSYILIEGGTENGYAVVLMYSDQADDANDLWQLSVEGPWFRFKNEDNADGVINIDCNGTAYIDATWNDNSWDYAELFEWKEHLASDNSVKDLYGMSVVLDGNQVRVAESGEEDKILGVVRPKGTTAAHGDGLKWQGKYIQNVWGEYEEEGYIQVNWQEFLPNGNVEYRHAYPKDEIPQYRLKEGVGRDKGSHTKEENFELNKDGEKIPVVVPSTEEEKTAANYIERTTHKSTGETLARRKYSDGYDPSIPYIRRQDRLKEWVLIGLLGQVPVRDTAVIPSHWVKQKNLESGIDKYYIFNK